jgi:hypothetical protein
MSAEVVSVSPKGWTCLKTDWDGRTLLKQILNRLDSAGSEWCPMAFCCQHGDQRVGSVTEGGVNFLSS